MIHFRHSRRRLSTAQPESSFDPRLFIIRYCCFLLLPLALWILYSCFAEGQKYEYGQVKITLAVANYQPGDPRVQGVRAGFSHSSASMDYMIWAETMDGRSASIPVSDHSEFRLYGEGDVLTTYYTVYRQAGEWGWSTVAVFLSKLWLGALVCIIFYLAIRQHQFAA